MILSCTCALAAAFLALATQVARSPVGGCVPVRLAAEMPGCFTCVAAGVTLVNFGNPRPRPLVGVTNTNTVHFSEAAGTRL